MTNVPDKVCRIYAREVTRMFLYASTQLRKCESFYEVNITRCGGHGNVLQMRLGHDW